jgi:hypothetical protein
MDTLESKLASTQNEEQDKKTSEYIYSESNYLGKFSELERFILNLAATKQKTISKNLSNSENQSLYFLSLSELAIEIKNSKSLSESLKKKTSIDEVLKLIIDYNHGGIHKVGYMYPVLYIDDGKMVCRINLLTSIEKKTLIQPYKEKFFTYSLPVLNMLFSGKIKSVKRLKEASTPENILLTISKNNELIYNPLSISFEHDIESFLKKAYVPYEFISNPEFVNDIIKYGNSESKLVQIQSNYHIIKDEIELDDMGKIKKFPEIFYHFWGHLKAIHKLVCNDLQRIAKRYNLLDIDSSIINYKNKFKEELDTDPFQELERANELIKIILIYPAIASNSQSEKILIHASKEGSNLLEIFNEKISTILEIGKKNLFENQILKFGNRISTTSRDKHIIQTIRISQIPEMATFKDPVMAKEFQNQILNYIHKNLGVYEETDSDDKKIYYVLDPGYYSLILLNHGNLASKGDSSKKLYEIVKKIHFQMLSKNIKLHIDSRINYLELQTIREGLAKLDEDFIRAKQKVEKESKFSPRIAFLTFFFCMLVFIGFSKLLNNPIFLIIALPTSGILAFLFGKVFKKEGFKNSGLKLEKNSKSSKYKNPKIDPFFELAEGIVFPNNFRTIEERVMTRKKLKKIIQDKYPSLRNKSLETFKNLDDQNALDTLENAITENSVTIEIPGELVPKNESNLFYFSKADLRSPLLRKKIIEYIHKESLKNKKLTSYYSYIISEINNAVNSI